MSEKTDEQLLAEAPEVYGLEKVRWGKPEKGELVWWQGREVIKYLLKDATVECAIYRKKKSKIRKTFDGLTFIPRWAIANTWRPALGATFLVGSFFTADYAADKCTGGKSAEVVSSAIDWVTQAVEGEVNEQSR